MSNMTTATMRRSGFGPLQIAITILVAATALVHLYLGASIVMAVIGGSANATGGGGITMGGPTMTAILGALFLCNFGGYVVLITALYLPMLRRFQRVTRALLIGYAAVTIAGFTAVTIVYFAIDRGHALNPIGLATSAVEAALILLLIIEGRRARE